MFQTLKNAWKIPELKNKLLFTLLIIVLYRLGSAIPLPWVNSDTLQSWFSSQGGNALGWLNVLSGGALSRATLFALSVSPYITASIVVQLLTIAIPKFTDWSKEGESGQKKLSLVTRWLTVVLALVTAVGYTLYISNSGMVQTYKSTWENVVVKIVLVACYCAGAALIMWLAERINEFGIGNGISFIIFASIVSSVPQVIVSMVSNVMLGTYKWWILPVLLVFVLIMVAGVVAVDRAVRRIPVQYAKRVVGRKMYGGQSTNIPLKANANGVMPLIFAMTLMQVPGMIGQFWPNGGFYQFYQKYLIPGTTAVGGIVYYVIYALLIVAFAYFYSSISFNPIEISKNLQQNGGFIPGIRPGKPTGEYLAKICNRLTLFGAFFLMLIAIIPALFMGSFGLNSMFGPTSILIMVSVALETSEQLESMMLMRHYKGFLG